MTIMPIIQDSLAGIEFKIDWSSESATHTDTYFGETINFWRDFFPPALYDKLLTRYPGDEIECGFAPGEIIPAYNPKQVFHIPMDQFDGYRSENLRIQPRYGRFYPKGMLKGLPNIFKENIEPFRCIDAKDTHITADFNHPLSGKSIRLTAKIHDVRMKKTDRGGTSTDWMETITTGPGIQVRCQNQPTDFFPSNAFGRGDDTPDPTFYEKTRLVTHTDSTAISIITGIYRKYLCNGMNVLDLMSSWKSHLPDDREFNEVTGLGMNAEEMANNDRLGRYVIHDLNSNSSLPFESNAFDAVVCSVSVEYMTRPFDVFKEVNRILKPGGPFVLTFSNRWFPPKVVNIWKEIHEFERIGLVLEYFLQSGNFGNLNSYSMRGLPRPEGDKYANQYVYSDPVFAVSGSKIE